MPSARSSGTSYSIWRQIRPAVQPDSQLPKIQDEVIAREIVINDAESSIRYRLTKRQTQEEIQRSPGAVVITRGKYRPPNNPPDSEKLLYLHISAGTHLKDTVERIKVVDLAASMVEDILKHGHTFQPGHGLPPASGFGAQVSQPLNTCVYLGFDPDPSVNIIGRIHGPNDQYINHIMNVTAASVVLRGGSIGCSEGSSDEKPQPLHLFISSSNARSLEAAKILAEDLLNTIATECGASRVASSKVYGAVPPPQQLLIGVDSPTTDGNSVKSVVGASTYPSLTSASVTRSTDIATTAHASASMATSSISHIHPQPQASSLPYPLPPITKSTSYTGYGDIYPQATPLQQVAQALRNAPASTSSVAVTSASAVSNAAPMTPSSQNKSGQVVEAERRSQRRKFQELPVGASGSSADLQTTQQDPDGLKLTAASIGGIGTRDVSSMPPPRKLIQPAVNGMPAPPRSFPMPPPRSTPPPPARITPPPPPPPPPKFSASESPPKAHGQLTSQNKQNAEVVPDTLLKLMEYGDEDDDDAPEGLNDQGLPAVMAVGRVAGKPFWAV